MSLRWIIQVLLCVCTMSARGQTAPTVPAWVWWEAEQPTSTNFPQKHTFEPADAQQADILSEGKWLGADGPRETRLFAEYHVTVPADATYSFYIRKFWRHGPFQWRFDDQPWREMGGDVALLDRATLRRFVEANWTHGGEVQLSAGQHTLRIELLDQNSAVAFDCFILTAGPFSARGKQKPGEKLNRAPEGWFAFEPDPDAFEPSPIDLRHLNESAAGDGGFIQARGDQLVHGNSAKPVVFWSVNAGPDTVRLDRASIDTLARSLAKRGVNMVRYHGPIYSDEKLNEIDPLILDKLFYFIAAMKREGIYTTLSIYFPLWVRLDKDDGFEGYDGKHPFALLFFNEQFQEVYRNWWRTLLTTPNPHTGVALNNDPAVAVAELVNEDSYLFWTFGKDVPAAQMRMLSERFGKFLSAKYGSLEKAFEVSQHDQDNLASGRAELSSVWSMAHEKHQRAKDTAEFLTREQIAFFERMQAFLKNDLQFKGCVLASNWITADPRVLGPLDKYSNTVCDLMDRHGYFGGTHEGDQSGYALAVGQRYSDASALLLQSSRSEERIKTNPIWDIQYNDKPSIISEINWPPPNRYRAELPLLSAAYGALQGTDGFYYFVISGPTWEQTLTKGAIQTPAILGQFPAAALMYRTGMIQRAPPSARIEVQLSDLFDLQGAPVRGPQNVDQFRKHEIPPGQAMQMEQVDSIDPLASLVGPVQMNVTEAGGSSRISDLSPYVDRAARRVSSSTGELAWDYGLGLVTIRSLQAEGVIGFLSRAGGDVKLGVMTVSNTNDYGAITLVALDGQPLEQSSRMLLQVMTEETNFGWTAPGDGVRPIVALGGPPIVVKNIQGTIKLSRTDAAELKVTPLDFNGYPIHTMTKPLGERLELMESVLYYLIEK